MVFKLLKSTFPPLEKVEPNQQLLVLPFPPFSTFRKGGKRRKSRAKQLNVDFGSTFSKGGKGGFRQIQDSIHLPLPKISPQIYFLFFSLHWHCCVLRVQNLQSIFCHRSQ